MNDLVAFLKARLDEDEALAQACIDEVGATREGEMYSDGSGPAEQDDYPSYPYGSRAAELAFMARFHPARVLAEVEANRRIIADYERMKVDALGTEDPQVATWALALNTALLHLALPYADHPDYRSEWKP